MTSSIDLLAKINDEFLTCQICFETYTRPKSLNCQHTFCQKCLEDYSPPNSASVTCPTCRCVQPLCENGINGLKDNFFISSMADMLKTVKEIRNDDEGASLLCETCDFDNRKVASSRCLDCTDFLCHECSIWHVRTKLTRHHKIVPLTEFEMGIHNEELKNRAKIYCTIHDGEIAKIYCLTCQCPICQECLESEHQTHERCSLKEEVSNQAREIEKLLKRSSSKVSILQNLQKSLKEIIQIKKSDRDLVHETIEKSCESFINAIIRRKQELIDELHNIHSVEIKHISADEDSVELQLSSLVSCSEFTQKVLEYGTPKEVLGLKNQMTLILQQLLETHPALTYHKMEQIDSIQFDHDPGVCTRIVRDHLGKISNRKIPVDNQLKKVLIELDTYCVAEIKENSLKAVDDPRVCAKELAEIKLLRQIGKQGMGDGEFESTPNIVINSANEIITSDFDGTKIQIFHPETDFKDSFITEMDQKIYKPVGVAILRNDDIVVCCEVSVNIWTHEGKSVLSFGHDFFQNCSCVAVNSQNHIIVADVGKHCVSVHNDTGKLITQFGSQGKAESKLLDPRYIACDSHNNIIVSDNGDCSIKKFDSQGEFLLSFGSEGPERGQFQGPRGVCADKFDNILVSDCWNHRIDLFTCDGCFIRHIATKFNNLHFPWCIALTSNGKLILSEDYSWSFKLFNLPAHDEGVDIDVSMEDFIAPPSAELPDYRQLDIPHLFNNKVSWWLTSSNLQDTSNNQNKTNENSNEDYSCFNGRLFSKPTTSTGDTSFLGKNLPLSSKVSSSSDNDSILASTASAPLIGAQSPLNTIKSVNKSQFADNISTSLKKSHSFMINDCHSGNESSTLIQNTHNSICLSEQTL